MELGFAIDGRIDEVLVAPGMRINQGDLLIRLFTPEKESQLRLLELRAQSTLEADAAAAELEVSKIRLARLEEALQRGGANDLELRQQLAETERSRLAVDLFKQRQREAQYQFTETMQRYRQYALESPITGIVDVVIAEVGEPVQAGRPVLRVVNTSRLIIDAAVPTARSLSIRLGDVVRIHPQLDNHTSTITGHVTHVASVADPASDTRIVRVELENPGTLPGGINVIVEFGGADRDSPKP